ncbi:hypothetical protein CDV55_104453 [Aspergillus turcosus]|uniref:DUF6891 domain-containing protein n=1 Tax=Aspergillus turcosus TaxID=1245748 RepID=A0A229XLZ2_9EURO|nr:hypothetical protein CDV55_104453 [Aspergillus turcosus]RLM00311.1 hypothetical protein CFD26_107106 [Aspergillus turcosus]
MPTLPAYDPQCYVPRQQAHSTLNPQLEEETRWRTGPTDAEKLQTAFSCLEDEDRIICCMKFSCCRTCGNAEIRGKANGKDIGYCFFHEQDIEAAVKDRGLSLRYGDVNKNSTGKSVLNIGRKIAARLREEGLHVDWGENPKKTINPDPFQWCIRLSQS